MIEQASAEKSIVRTAFAADAIGRRALITMVNEAALLLAEGVAQRPSDIDLALVYGYGFPNYQGGPLFWAADQAPSDLVAELDRLQSVSGVGFRRGDVLGLLKHDRRRLNNTKA